MSEPASTPPTPPPRGFGYSRRRVFLEASLLIGGVLALALLVIWGAGLLAYSLAEKVPADVDVAIGKHSWAQLAPESQRCSNDGPTHYVERLAQPLLDQLSDSPYSYHFTVVDNPDVNAFALPGGFVTVNMGLLKKAKSGEEVAAVLAHEIAHVTERHGMKRILRQMGGMAVLAALLGGTDLEAIGYVVAGMIHNAYDRDQEAEADAVGRRLLMDAGISPVGMVEFFERLSQEQAQVPELLSTHPDPGNRAESARTAAKGFAATRTLEAPSDLRCR